MKHFFLLIFLFCADFMSHAQTQLWGLTSQGGIYGAGTIFSTDSFGGNQRVEYSLIKMEGRYPEYLKLTEASDGKLYGLTSGGGSNNLGVLFQYDPATNIYVKKVDFIGSNGSQPEGSLTLGNDGKLYGMTTLGGANGKGVVFQYDPITNTYVKKIDMSSINGNFAAGKLMLASDGMFYGMTMQGGTNNMGVLFQYDPVGNIYTKKIDFNGANGNYAFGSMIELNDGKLYGMTYLGGTNNVGILFQYDPLTNVLVKKIDFNGAANGGYPAASMVLASNGLIYGTTILGGANNKGTLFEYNHVTNSLVKKIDFAGNLNGSTPYGTLMQANDGKLYGLTYDGGVLNLGVLYQFNPSNGAFVKKADFTGVANGGNSRAELMQASNGKLYGCTEIGGVYNYGVLFEYNINATSLVKKIDISDNYTNGESPQGSLMQANDGMFYGMTKLSGLGNAGVLFKYEPNTHTYTKKVDFGGTIGAFPMGALIQASDGMLYATTVAGGVNNLGTIIQFNPQTGICTKKIDFDGSSNGGAPGGSLIEANDGKLYGLTEGGGINSKGVLFQYDPVTNILVKKVDFDGAGKGRGPYGTLMQGSDGKLYGVTQQGGLNDYGVLFQFNPATNAFVKKIDFSSLNGIYPKGFLVETPDGKMYGLTGGGGVNNKGVLYQYNPSTGGYAKKVEFDGVNLGMYPYASLKLANNGLLYGLTSAGGTNDYGVMFQYDPNLNGYIKKIDFTGPNGQSPKFTTLIEADITISTGTLAASYCIGDTLKVSYATTGYYNSNNLFIVQLSDPAGGFTSPTAIGSFSSTALSGTLAVQIPTFVTQGNGYRVRVVSTDLPITGNNNGSNITLNITPTVSVNSGSVCAGNSFTITPTGASTYSYSGGSAIVTPSTNSTYTVVGADSNGCTNTAVSSVSVNALPVVAASTSNSLICSGTTVTLTATGATSYTWNTGENTTDIVTTPTINTTYVVNGEDSNGCLNSANLTQSVTVCTNLVGTSDGDFFHIYPNPTSEILNIKLISSDRDNVNIQLLNALGEVTVNEKQLSDNIKLNIKHLNNGIYYLKVAASDKQQFFKIIKY